MLVIAAPNLRIWAFETVDFFLLPSLVDISPLGVQSLVEQGFVCMCERIEDKNAYKAGRPGGEAESQRDISEDVKVRGWYLSLHIITQYSSIWDKSKQTEREWQPRSLDKNAKREYLIYPNPSQHTNK